MVSFAASAPEGESGSFFLFSVSLFSGLCFIKAELLTSHPLRATRYSAGEEDEDTAPLIHQKQRCVEGGVEEEKNSPSQCLQAAFQREMFSIHSL